MAAFLSTCFLTFSLLAAEEKPPPRVEPSPQAPPGQALEWTDGRGKPFWYRLPRRMDPRKPPALILMLHGTGLKWGWAFWNYPIATGAFRGEDIVVAPEGMAPGQGDTFNFIQNRADGDHIAELILSLRSRVPVGKVYLYGHSQGAFFCYWFAGEHPELVDGIVAHAGNVLDVKHSALAKEKVAIGILHGRADAVVPVDCALRTEKIYKEQGYRQVKLDVVDGLTEQSGHWPLPKQAGEMLAWLDSVAVDSPRLAVESALHVLRQTEPDLATLADCVTRAGALVKTSKGKDRAALTERQEALRALVDEAARAHGAAVEAASKSGKADAPFNAWAAHFQRSQRALAGNAAWQKSAAGAIRRAAGQEKTVARALALFEQAQVKSLDEALKALEGGFLARHYEDLLNRAAAAAEGAGTKPEDRRKLEALVSSRRAAWDEGWKAGVAIDQGLAKSFREAHAAWFAVEAATGSAK